MTSFCKKGFDLSPIEFNSHVLKPVDNFFVWCLSGGYFELVQIFMAQFYKQRRLFIHLERSSCRVTTFISRRCFCAIIYTIRTILLVFWSFTLRRLLICKFSICLFHIRRRFNFLNGILLDWFLCVSLNFNVRIEKGYLLLWLSF